LKNSNTEAILVLWDYLIFENKESSIFMLCLAILIQLRQEIFQIAKSTRISDILSNFVVKDRQMAISLCKSAVQLEKLTPVSFQEQVAMDEDEFAK
jgi:hypothetical protein